MPTPTYTPLATVTLGTTASSVTFSSIPATYRDLIVVGHYTASGSSGSTIRFNSDSGTNYSLVAMWSGNFGPGTVADSNSGGIAWTRNYLDETSNRAAGFAQIMDYSATDKHKTVLLRNASVFGSGANDGGIVATAARWANTSAITTVSITQGIGYVAGSTFSLYGVIA
jgi:hypothetical protein